MKERIAFWGKQSPGQQKKVPAAVSFPFLTPFRGVSAQAFQTFPGTPPGPRAKWPLPQMFPHQGQRFGEVFPGPGTFFQHKIQSDAEAVRCLPPHPQASHSPNSQSLGLWWPRDGCNILILGLLLPFLISQLLGILFWGATGAQLLDPP